MSWQAQRQDEDGNKSTNGAIEQRTIASREGEFMTAVLVDAGFKCRCEMVEIGSYISINKLYIMF